MKRLLSTLLTLIFLLNVYAQTVIVEDDSKNVQGTKRKGISTKIRLDADFVSDAWKDYLKNYGRVSSSGSDYTIENPEIPGITSGAGTSYLYSTIKKERESTLVFLSVDLGNGFPEDGSPEYVELKELLHKFGVKVYRADVQIQIDDAEKAVEATVKLQDKTINEGEKLEHKLEKNLEEKEKLELLLKQNAEQKILNAEKNE